MLKIVMPDAWNFHDKLAQVVNVSSRGLRGYDLDSFIKRAGHDFASALANADLAPDEVPVHQIVVGATEKYGPNRNGDGFPADACRDYAWTFEKFGRLYRHHKNKDPDKSYGRIIKAAFYEPLQRIELLIGFNGSEKTAAVNGGLVADQELQKLANGEDLAFSMGCKVPYDICSGCGNKAKTREHYCTEQTCSYGGLKRNMTKVASDGLILHAINDRPTFFDNSVVLRPADRTAYSFGKMMQKAASTGIYSGSELAIIENLTAPIELIMDDIAGLGVSDGARAAMKLASHLSQYDADWKSAEHVCPAFSPRVRERIHPLPDTRGGAELPHMFAALAQEKIALPVREFLAVTLGDYSQADAAAEQVAARLPGIFDRLLKSAAILQENPYAVRNCELPVKWRLWASKLAADFSFEDQHILRRRQLAALRNIEMPAKLACMQVSIIEPDMGVEKLAQQYALYQLAFLQHLESRQDPEFSKIASFTCASNRVI